MVSFWATERKGLNRDVGEAEEALCNWVNSPGQRSQRAPLCKSSCGLTGWAEPLFRCFGPPVIPPRLCAHPHCLEFWPGNKGCQQHQVVTHWPPWGSSRSPASQVPDDGDAECPLFTCGPSRCLLWRNVSSGTLPLFNWLLHFSPYCSGVVGALSIFGLLAL